MPIYKLYSRTDCGLCEEMLAQLYELGVTPEQIEWVDIDQRSELVAMYGNRIPVLERRGMELTAGRLSEESLQQLRS